MPDKDKLSTTMRIDLLADGPEDGEQRRQVRIRPATRLRIRHRGDDRGSCATTRIGDADFQELLQSVYDAALICDVDGRVLDVNSRAEKFFGKTAADLCRQSVTDLISGADESLLSKITDSLELDRFILIQAFCIRENGSLFPSEISINRLNLSTRGYLCFFVRDTTHRRNVEERLRTGYNAIQNAGNGIAVADLDGVLKYVNPALVTLWGFERQGELLGRNLRVFLCREGDADEMIGAVGNLATWTGEIESIRRDGSTLFMQASVAPNVDSDGQLVGMVLSLLDITERKRAEAELEIIMEELRRSNTDLEQFAYVVSHDLQEPLRKITAFGDRLSSRCAGILPEPARDYLERMEAAAHRMQDLIKALLTLSRVSTKARPFERVDLNETVAGVLSDLEARVQREGGIVDVGDLSEIDAEPVQMRQLFQNLIGNALKFHAEGAAPRVRVFEREPVGAAVGGIHAGPLSLCEFVVADNGIGFEEKDLERIFGVFQRLHGRGRYEGTGIGLAICRKIVERHGGEITARSRPGVGTEFIVRLPREREAPVAR